jgi:hypothetical protein
MFNPSEVKKEQKYGIPVGTSNVVEINKFLFDKRDKECKSCKNGYKSVIPKQIGQAFVPIPVICTCVPYIQSKDGNSMVVVYKGNREMWKSNDRPEVYIQKEISDKLKMDSVKSDFKKLRKGTTAHDSVNVGKYVVGLNTPNQQMREIVKSTDTPKVAESVKPLEKSELDMFLEKNGKRRSAFRTKEGSIVVLDSETAKRMGAEGLLASTIAPAASKAAAPNPTENSSDPQKPADETKKHAGRPKGAKNKVKTSLTDIK